LKWVNFIDFSVAQNTKEMLGVVDRSSSGGETNTKDPSFSW
jgi:hypothetical protein